MFRKKKFRIVLIALAVVVGSAFAYFRFTRPENQEAETAPLQTAVVRQGGGFWKQSCPVRCSDCCT